MDVAGCRLVFWNSSLGLVTLEPGAWGWALRQELHFSRVIKPSFCVLEGVLKQHGPGTRGLPSPSHGWRGPRAPGGARLSQDSRTSGTQAPGSSSGPAAAAADGGLTVPLADPP